MFYLLVNIPVGMGRTGDVELLPLSHHCSPRLLRM